jgi:sulfatase maturation enzyme AslB (radical SAM superfamily)
MTFCKSLNNAVSFRIPGDSNTLTFNPCCLYDDFIPFHPTLFKKERNKYTSATTFLPECSKCELKERTHNNSLRITSNRDIPDGIGNDIYKLEIVLDTTCNAACIQCGSTQSSLWRKEIDTVKKIHHIQPEQQIDNKILSIKNNIDLNKVKFFHFWGGEPLLTDTHLKFLREIEDPSDVSLAYTTNCSIFPDDEVLKLWERFKEIKIGLSIDGIGDKFHYIRWPLTWNKAQRNLEQFRDNTPLNIRYHVNCCIIPLNAFYVGELGEYLKDSFSQSRNGLKVSYNFIRGEGTMDIAKTPMSLREEIWKRLPENHDVSNVLRELPVLEYTDMLEHIDYWDPIRKLNWRKIFPDIVKHFK